MPKVKFGKTKSHTIYRTQTGKIVPGASTVAKFGEDTGGMTHRAWQLGMQGLDYRKVWDKAADAGTVAHFMVKCHLKGDEPDLSEFSPEVVDMAENVFLKFLDMWDREGYQPVASELELVSENGFGGTLDTVGRDRNGQLGLIDLKSSTRIYFPHIVQLSAYDHLWREHNAESCERWAIFRCGKKEKGDTEWRWLGSLQPYFQHFLLLLAAYESRKRFRDK